VGALERGGEVGGGGELIGALKAASSDK